LAFLITFTENK